MKPDGPRKEMLKSPNNTAVKCFDHGPCRGGSHGVIASVSSNIGYEAEASFGTARMYGFGCLSSGGHKRLAGRCTSMARKEQLLLMPIQKLCEGSDANLMRTVVALNTDKVRFVDLKTANGRLFGTITSCLWP